MGRHQHVLPEASTGSDLRRRREEWLRPAPARCLRVRERGAFIANRVGGGPRPRHHRVGV